MSLDPRAGERAALGSRCRELMNSETFTKAIEALEAYYTREVMKTGPHESEKRDHLMLEYTALKRVVKRLTDWEHDGTMAAEELERAN